MKKCFRASAAILITILLCVLCNFAAFLIDTEDMRQHTWQGCLMLGEQQGTPQMVGGFASSQLDNFTSVLILKTAGYVGDETLVRKALCGFRVDAAAQPGQSEWDAFCNYESGQNLPTGGLSYSRYWHGYTLPLRLLLCVLNVANIQMLLYFAQLALFIFVLHMMNRRGLKRLIPGFFLAYFLLMPFSSSICLQYVPVTMLMLGACAAVLLWDDKIDSFIGMPGFFILLGVLTNYFDLLTFPLVALGFPIALLLALRLQTNDSFLRLFMMTAACGIGWALGYAGMWMFKWVLVDMISEYRMIWSLMTQIFLRTSNHGAGSEISRIGVIMQNLNVILAKSSYLLLIAITGLWTLIPSVKACIKRKAIFDARALMLLIVAAVPLVWYFVMANHSFDHTYYTYRNVTMSVIAGFAFITCCLKEKSGDAL